MIKKLWRRLIGEPYVLWVTRPPVYRTQAYMSAGVRMFWQDDRLYIHQDDIPIALAADFHLPREGEP